MVCPTPPNSTMRKQELLDCTRKLPSSTTIMSDLCSQNLRYWFKEVPIMLHVHNVHHHTVGLPVSLISPLLSYQWEGTSSIIHPHHVRNPCSTPCKHFGEVASQVSYQHLLPSIQSTIHHRHIKQSTNPSLQVAAPSQQTASSHTDTPLTHPDGTTSSAALLEHLQATYSINFNLPQPNVTYYTSSHHNKEPKPLCSPRDHTQHLCFPHPRSIISDAVLICLEYIK